MKNNLHLSSKQLTQGANVITMIEAIITTVTLKMVVTMIIKSAKCKSFATKLLWIMSTKIKKRRWFWTLSKLIGHFQHFRVPRITTPI